MSDPLIAAAAEQPAIVQPALRLAPALSWRSSARRCAHSTLSRRKRAPRSNRDGWDAIVGASSMLSEPTFGLPLWLFWLLRELEKAPDRDQRTPRSVVELRADAELVLELAARLTGRPEVFAELMITDGISDTWLIELPMALAWGELVDEAVRVGDALAELDGDNPAMFASDVAVILAEAGRGEEALERVEQNLRRFPDDLWTQIHAGDVHLALSDRSSAEQAFRAALAGDRARTRRRLWDRGRQGA
ncbi:MAG: hypothetical protein WBP81_07260, partial [Solirubrobacteraceae bacterium]